LPPLEGFVRRRAQSSSSPSPSQSP
jgi:hypothetical protein